MGAWGYYQFGELRKELSEEPDEPQGCLEFRDDVLPRVSRLLEADHLNLLIGSGFTLAAGQLLGVPAIDMAPRVISSTFDESINKHAGHVARLSGRGTANVEDQFRAVLELLGGLRVQEAHELGALEKTYGDVLKAFARSVLATERGLVERMDRGDDVARNAQLVLSSFLMAFGRKSTRERLHIFTTNYDRLIEYVCDLVGLWKLDRFVGGLSPRFRASRMDIDLHYNPPGTRGEPRYLEGVVRLTKLHGSIDWIFKSGSLLKTAMPFGCGEEFFDLVGDPADALIVYPNPAKDIETGEFPYSELFRDFSNAVVRPNSALVTYGYGFGDSHVNRVLLDMLSLQGTHLLLISHAGVEKRVDRFLDSLPRLAQVTVLVGPHFGDLSKLTRWYLPQSLRDVTGGGFMTPDLGTPVDVEAPMPTAEQETESE